MTIPITVRPIRTEDEAFLFQVYVSTREEELALVAWGEAEKTAFLQQQFNAQHQFYTQNYPEAEFHVIMLDDVPIGRLYIQRRADEIRIMDIALLPDYRNRGIGSTLLKGVLAEGDRRGLPVTIHVEVFNPALRLYERLGFRQIAGKGVYCFMERAPIRS